MKKKIRKIFIYIFIFSFLAVLYINFYMISKTEGKIASVDSPIALNADCIIVFGAGVYGDTPSPMLKDRLDTAIKLYNDGICGKIIMSGDHGQKNYDEVNVMKEYATEKGVPSEDVFMDHAGFSTYESLYRANYIFKAQKVILVTQRYHLYRALYLADCLGFEAIGVETPPRIYGGEKYREAREVVARCKDFIYALTNPKPTFLGDAIPVSGNGDLTND